MASHDIDINEISLNVNGSFALQSGGVLLIEDEEGSNPLPMHICCMVNKKSTGSKVRFTVVCSSIWYNDISFDLNTDNTVKVMLDAAQPSSSRSHLLKSVDVDDVGQDIDVEFYEVGDINTTKKSYGKKPKHTIVYSGIVE